MTRVLHIFGKMDRAGAETRTLEVMRNINRSNYVFDFLACSGQDGDYDKEIETLGGIVYKEYIYSLRFIPNLYRLIRRNRYDIVHSHIHYVSGLIMLIAWVAGCRKRISHFRTAGSRKGNRTIKNRVMKILVSLFSTNIVAVNHYTMDCTWGKEWKNYRKCSVLVNGIESKYVPMYNSDMLKRELELGDSKVILHVGRIEKEKNHVFLIQVFAHYITAHPNTKLLLVGRNNTQEAEVIIDKIKELGIQDKVIITGLRSDIYAFLNMADIMVFPSLWEGLPGAVLEALSAGLPVVASDIGCHQEIKKYIESLHIVNLNDNLHKWSNAIETALQNDVREDIRQQFLNSPYYIDRYVEEFINLYEG